MGGSGKRSLRTLRLFAVYSILAVLLYFALRNAPLVDIWNALNQLKLWHRVASTVAVTDWNRRGRGTGGRRLS